MLRSSHVGVLLALLFAPAAFASVDEFEQKIDQALQRFYGEVPNAQQMTDNAAGVLIFPQVIKAGFGLGGALGDGALRVHGQTVQYYRTTALSFGFEIGAQGRTEVLLFTTQDALDAFRRSQNWEAGIDGSIAIIRIGVGKSIDTDTIRQPIVGFIFDNKGLMYDLSLKGSKYWRITKR